MFCDGFDVRSHDIGLTIAEIFVEIPVGAKAKTLLPGVIKWLEMRIVGDAGRRLLHCFGAENGFGGVGEGAAELEEDKGDYQKLGASQL